MTWNETGNYTSLKKSGDCLTLTTFTIWQSESWKRIQVFYPSEFIKVKSLEQLVEENGDKGKPITYLKLDVEGTELDCMKKWLQSGVMKSVEQIGILIEWTSVDILHTPPPHTHKLWQERWNPVTGVASIKCCNCLVGLNTLTWFCCTLELGLT